MLFTRKNVRTDSKVLLFNFLNEMMTKRNDFENIQFNFKSFYEFFTIEFHNNHD